MIEVTKAALAYLQGVLDALPRDDRSWVDTWHAFGDYDFNVFGSEYHDKGNDVLCVAVHKAGDYSTTLFLGEGK